MVQSVRPSSRGLQALLLASNLEAGGARKPIEVEIPPMMEKPRRSILSLPSESPALSYRDPDSETPADKLATELTLSLSLEDLLAEHPRFGLAFDSMRDDEKSNLRMAWADPRAPGGLREMVSACWVQELFDWVLIKNAVLRSDRKKTSRSAASSPAARNHHSGHGNGKQLAMSPGGVMRLPSPALGPLKKSQFTRNDSACSRLLQTMPCGDANPVHARQSLVSADVFVRIQAPGMLSPGQRSRCMSSPTMSADRRISLLPCVASDDVIPEGFNLLGRIEGFHDNSCRVAVGRQYAVGGVSEPVSPVSMGSPACMGNAPNSTEVAAGSPGQARSDQLFRFPSTSSAAAAPFATLPQSLGTKNSYRNGSKGGRSSQPAVRPLVARPDGEEGQGLPPQEICLSYGGPECYPVWAELVASELALLKGRGSGRRGSHRAAESVRNNWFVPVPDLARFISDDRTALPEKESKRKRVMHTPLSPGLLTCFVVST
ncbi:hypothetical protein DIPPA_22807 [Diplonema papillatum]|nr:hypothetical protein DIPPA_22807 [Diplonema papillatum]